MTRRWLDTVSAPDGDRVTLIIEPRLDRAFNAMSEVQGFADIHAPFPSLGEILGVIFKGDRQRRLTKKAWLVRIEADSGRKKVLLATDQADAERISAAVAQQVRTEGVGALDDLA